MPGVDARGGKAREAGTRCGWRTKELQPDGLGRTPHPSSLVCILRRRLSPPSAKATVDPPRPPRTSEGRIRADSHPLFHDRIPSIRAESPSNDGRAHSPHAYRV
ncbi:hypothetical protein M422DRAFT_262070 [Sphaerobolus stellatus SS14]|uniref:Uncharacterized protein n=1 Tax=Sphaerobolus stellatus (strain SS14) TaxID=990650 RepID=A0A0C9VDJ4_SPHS4|nr:hypothetical protein M422DRAFT_262070 [Sphaerobolus stellatus SS14]